MKKTLIACGCIAVAYLAGMALIYAVLMQQAQQAEQDCRSSRSDVVYLHDLRVRYTK